MSNFTISWKAMGCHLQVWLSTTSEQAAALGEVPIWFDLWEAKFSRFRPTSELTFLNRHAGQWIEVSAEMFTVIQAALKLADQTNGRFNPLILTALKAAGYTTSFDPDTFVPGVAPNYRNLDSVVVPDWHQIEVNSRLSYVRLPENAELDLGGIVKGWAAQQATQRLAKIGPCLVDAGGDMIAYGSPDESGGWWVTLPLPSDPRVLLTDAAIATSGTTYRNWRRDGQILHHLINPQTGQPASTDVVIAAAISPEATTAEAWAKSVLIAGSVSPLPEIPILLVLNDGSHRLNDAFQGLMQSYSAINI